MIQVNGMKSHQSESDPKHELRRSVAMLAAALVSHASGCGTQPVGPPAIPETENATTGATASTAFVDIRRHGFCDASAAVGDGRELSVIASDEDNTLRVYYDRSAGFPGDQVPLDKFLGIIGSEEADIEGAARLGERVFWCGSHGRNRAGQARPNRQRLFATKFVTSEKNPAAMTVQPDGVPYKNLLTDMIAAPGLSGLNLAAASARPSDAIDGLNIEGLAGTPDGHLLLGFRAPLLDNKALVVQVKNPVDLVTPGFGGSASFGDPVLLDLGGRGIRSLEYVESRKEYLILAGPYAEQGTFKLYVWSGPGRNPIVLLDTEETFLDWLRPEGLFVYPEEDRPVINFISDDGGDNCNGFATGYFPLRASSVPSTRPLGAQE